MKLHSGQVSVDGRLCYVPQQPWLLNATLRENVLFGQPFDKHRSLNCRFSVNRVPLFCYMYDFVYSLTIIC